MYILNKQYENINNVYVALNNMTYLMIGWIKKTELINLKNQMFIQYKLLNLEH